MAKSRMILGRKVQDGPNFQNIGPLRREEAERIRKALITEDWQLVNADYSTTELRILMKVQDELKETKMDEKKAQR